ncbi:hypothetical protein SOVF_066040, partial [Spinacia oleracea]
MAKSGRPRNILVPSPTVRTEQRSASSTSGYSANQSTPTTELRPGMELRPSTILRAAPIASPSPVASTETPTRRLVMSPAPIPSQ